jgi:hypothetical protein
MIPLRLRCSSCHLKSIPTHTEIGPPPSPLFVTCEADKGLAGEKFLRVRETKDLRERSFLRREQKPREKTLVRETNTTPAIPQTRPGYHTPALCERARKALKKRGLSFR